MHIYLYLFLFHCVFYISNIFFKKNIDKLYCILSFLLLVFFRGLRDKIGGDWNSFLYTYEYSQKYQLVEYLIISQKSFLYSLIEWFSSYNNLSIYFLNTICASIFTYGLISFCSYQYNIYIGMIVATPYLINVVSMGYTKQSVAIGFILLILRKKNLLIKDFLFYFLAISFHFTSVFIIVTSFFNTKLSNKKIFYFILVIIIIFIFFYNQIYSFYNIYFLDKFDHNKVNLYTSKGVYYRSILTAIPALIFIYNYKKFRQIVYWRFWLILSFIAIILAILAFIFPAFSTPFDRLGLYLIPIQILVFANIIYIFNNSKRIIVINLFIIAVYFLYQLTWLNFAITKNAWVPYNNFFFR